MSTKTATLADAMRPTSFDDIIGQEHLFGRDGIVRSLCGRGYIKNMVFYGPSGIGKTTAAEIISKASGMSFYKLNATTSSLSDIKDIMGKVDTLEGNYGAGILLYIDEIQYFNKKQQQSVLEYIENGSVTFIASTTENPYFYIYNAVLSRCNIFEFLLLNASDIEKAIVRGMDKLAEITGGKKDIEGEAVKKIAFSAGGDVRKALNMLEFAYLAEPSDTINLKSVDIIARSAVNRYDKDGNEHYNLLSALHKSIRGSDENAALHYLARFIEAGDIISPSRRILCVAAEDVGLAYPLAMPVVKSLIDTAERLGLPEARMPLAEAVIFLCTCPKSNSAINAINAAIADIKENAADSCEIPRYLTDGDGYKYPHGHKNNYIKQQYLPDKLKDRVYYKFGENKTERAAEEYRKKIEAECGNGKSK